MMSKPGFRGIPLMLAGLIMMGAAVGLLLYNRQTERAAGEQAAIAVEPLAEAIISRASQPIPTDIPDLAVLAADDSIAAAEESVTVMGDAYAGILEIPALNLTLPVYAECTYANLNSAPCRYSGAAGEDLVLAGHNYSTHFGKLMKLSSGDTVYYTDACGRVFTYQVALIETLAPYAVDEMKSGEYELTLFTCTYGGQNRVTVRCAASEE